MPLTDIKIRQAKPREKAYKLADGGGLYIEVKANGAKAWRYRYRIAGKENIFAIAAYPDMSLADARFERIKAAELVRQGVHPAHERAKAKAARTEANANTFQAVADEWLATKKWGAKRDSNVRSWLKRDVYPKVGRRPIRSIMPPEWLAIVRGVADRGAPNSAVEIRQIVSQIYTYAISNLRADNDPTYPLRRAIAVPPVQHADAKSRDDIRFLLSRIREYGGFRTTAIAVRLILLLFVRTKELRETPWSEIRAALEDGVWGIPAHRMKKKRKHMVPLPHQAVALLKELATITGANEHLFPNTRRPREVMSAQTINRALEYMGFKPGVFTGHDFRATASTILHEMGYRDEVVEMQLAHAKSNKVGAAYNHAAYLEDRITMMQAWADWIDSIEAELTASKLDVSEPPRKKRIRRALKSETTSRHQSPTRPIVTLRRA